MKSSRILQAAILMLILASAASCRTSHSIPESRRYPEYPVYRHNDPYDLPPGQTKKIYGSRSAKSYAPGQRKKYGYSYRSFPLIIIRTPDIIIGRYRDGRYYYRNPEGFMYWKGLDGRYYLDENYSGRIKYDEEEYREWKYKGKRHDDEWKHDKYKKDKYRKKDDK